MKIRILQNYGGKRTNEQRILPGVYGWGDSALFGLEDYLIELGKAIAVTDETPLSSFVVARPQEDATFHNQMMKRKGRPLIDTSDPTPEELAEAERLAQEITDMGDLDTVTRISLEMEAERLAQSLQEQWTESVESTQLDGDPVSPEAFTREHLELRYEEIYGRKPPSNISDETLLERVNEKQDELPSSE